MRQADLEAADGCDGKYTLGLGQVSLSSLHSPCSSQSVVGKLLQQPEQQRQHDTQALTVNRDDVCWTRVTQGTTYLLQWFEHWYAELYM